MTLPTKYQLLEFSSIPCHRIFVYSLLNCWDYLTIFDTTIIVTCLNNKGNVCMCVHVLSPFNYVRLFATLWAVAQQAPLSMGFSRQEHWSGLPCPPPGDLSDPGIKPMFLISPALAGRFFTTNATWEHVVANGIISFFFMSV